MYLFTWSINPSQMSEVRVNAARNNFGVNFFKFFNSIGKGQNFRWTNKRTGNMKDKWS